MKEFPVFCITEDTKPYTKQLKLWTVRQPPNVTTHALRRLNGNVWNLQCRDTRTTHRYSTSHSQHHIICKNYL